MGGSASKVAKSKVIRPVESILPSAKRSVVQPIISSKPAPAEGEDLNYLKNLSALGAVSVPKLHPRFKPDSRMLDILSSRRKAVEEEEQIAVTPMSNRIPAQTLSNLLDERKSAKSRAEIEAIAKEYGVDMSVLDELAKHINSPSVSSIKSASAKEEDEETQLSRWVDPPAEVSNPIKQLSN